MTKKLYYDSAYLQEWHTSVSQVIEREDGLFLILEETAFYPHGGGQPCDAGSIGGIPVLDVILEEDEVLHKVETMPSERKVSCQIDWNRRFDHMQQHSGQHLLSAVFRELYQAMTLSFHLGNDYATIDIELQELTPDQLAAAGLLLHTPAHPKVWIFLERRLLTLSGLEYETPPLNKNNFTFKLDVFISLQTKRIPVKRTNSSISRNTPA